MTGPWPGNRRGNVAPSEELEASVEGARVANALGVPGTLGCVARIRGGTRLVLVSAHHVLFGDGAQVGARIWAVGDGQSPDGAVIARALHGRIGTLQHAGAPVFVDAAVAALEPARALELLAREAGPLAPQRVATAVPGLRVTKIGAASGWTAGIAASTTHADEAWLDGRHYRTPGQLLIRPLGDQPFCAAGDSGASVRDADGAIIGLLWGVTERGEGLASPIAPVAWVLGLRLLRWAGRPARPAAHPARAALVGAGAH